jgi:hypothetical protein
MPDRSLAQARTKLRGVPPDEIGRVHLSMKKIVRRRSFVNRVKARCHVEQVSVTKFEELKNRASSTFLVSLEGPASKLLDVVDWIEEQRAGFSFELEFN